MYIHLCFYLIGSLTEKQYWNNFLICMIFSEYASNPKHQCLLTKNYCKHTHPHPKKFHFYAQKFLTFFCCCFKDWWWWVERSLGVRSRCFSKTPESGFQQMAHKCLQLWLQEIQASVSIDTCTNVHIPTHRHIHIKDKNKYFPWARRCIPLIPALRDRQEDLSAGGQARAGCSNFLNEEVR